MKNEIKENGILIALFMGAKYWNDDPKEYPDGYYMGEDLPLEPENWFFHSHWDWLMLCVQKISLDYEGLPDKWFSTIAIDSPIELVYDAIIKYLKHRIS